MNGAADAHCRRPPGDLPGDESGNQQSPRHRLGKREGAKQVSWGAEHVGESNQAARSYPGRSPSGDAGVCGENFKVPDIVSSCCRRRVGK